MLYELRKDRGYETIPMRTALLAEALLTDDAYEVLNKLEEPYLTRTDPYFENKAIEDPTWFYGRGAFLDRLPPMLAQGQHVGIFGLRKVGKTSLIKQLRQRLNYIPTVFIDCQAFSEDRARYFFEEILRQLRIELRALGLKNLPTETELPDAEAFRQAFLALFEVWKASGQHGRFLLTFDEIDKLLPPHHIIDSDQIRTEYVRLFRVLRGLAQAHNCLVTLVVSLRPDVNRRNLLGESVGENPMFRSFKEEYLGFLSQDETTAMIREIGLWKQIIWDEDAAARVYHYSGGHALISRMIASHACEEGTLKHVDLVRLEKAAGDLQRTLAKNDIGNYYKEGVWDTLSSVEQETLRLICQHGSPFPEPLLPRALEDGLANLENFGLVRQDAESLLLTADLFQQWLNRKFTP